MADENKINDMEELNLEELEKAAGGRKSQVLEEMCKKYGVNSYGEALSNMTREEMLAFSAELKGAPTVPVSEVCIDYGRGAYPGK